MLLKNNQTGACYPRYRSKILQSFLYLFGTTAFLLLPFDLFPQKAIKSYVQANAVPIANINNAPSDNYVDLEAIGNAIADSKVVMLGEQDHGDAPSFLAKTRLIKYLHEKKGFNILAFESDFFGLNEGWDELQKTKPQIQSFLKENIFPIWTRCDACEELFDEYLPGTFKTNRPLQISGLDSQVFLRYSAKHLVKQLDSLARKLNLPITLRPEYARVVLPAIDSLYRFTEPVTDTTVYKKALSYLAQIKAGLTQKLPAEDFWIMTVQNLTQEYRQFK